MVFRSRNPYYLRISEKNILPLYVYLDEAHLDWMTDGILQHVLADLQPKILPKLKAEADALKSTPAASKKATVDTHRGDSYQFCYFIRKTEQHSVLIKTRHFSAAPPRTKPNMPPPPPPQPQGSKRKGRKNNTQSANKRRKTKGKGKAPDGDVTDEDVSSGDEDAAEPEGASAQPRRSQRSKKIVAGGYQQDNDVSPDSDVEMEDRLQNDLETDSIQVKDEMTEPQLTQNPTQHESGGAAAPIDIDIDEEEEKPKPILNLKYQDFSIYGHCLVIVVEPYPALRAPSRAASRAPTVAPLFASRARSAAPSSAATLRARTPLFLPDDEDRGETPAPFIGQGSRPPVPLFDEDEEDDDGAHSDNGGMMAFSQVMNNYGHLPAGAADDDDEFDGAVFFGDADEIRELD
ncbi:hypothetical protein K438DRAFT_1826492 [Mycena galopus ATCC 62051]|nr:hypothetical protein K438DRAFT_1826492 [Mycena galopus ATCC 62051]